MEWASVKVLQTAIAALCATAVFLKGLGDGATWIMPTWKWHHGIGQPQGMRVCMFLLSHLEDKGKYKAVDRGGLRKSAASLQQTSLLPRASAPSVLRLNGRWCGVGPVHDSVV